LTLENPPCSYLYDSKTLVSTAKSVLLRKRPRRIIAIATVPAAWNLNSYHHTDPSYSSVCVYLAFWVEAPLPNATSELYSSSVLKCTRGPVFMLVVVHYS